MVNQYYLVEIILINNKSPFVAFSWSNTYL